MSLAFAGRSEDAIAEVNRFAELDLLSPQILVDAMRCAGAKDRANRFVFCAKRSWIRVHATYFWAQRAMRLRAFTGAVVKDHARRTCTRRAVRGEFRLLGTVISYADDRAGN